MYTSGTPELTLGFIGVHVAPSLVFHVYYCFSFCLCFRYCICLFFFVLRFLITPVASSTFYIVKFLTIVKAYTLDYFIININILFLSNEQRLRAIY